MCIRAGKIAIKVEIYHFGKKLSENVLTFTPTIYMPYSKGNLYNSEELKITEFGLSPYSKAGQSTPKEDYRLKISVIKEKL